MSERQPAVPAPEPAPGGAPRSRAPLSADEDVSTLKRVVNTVGVDNLSLVLALILIVAVVIYLQPLFLSWQNLMNSLSQSIVIVGLLALGETVVIVAGMLDISVGSIASVASVTAATAIVYGSVFMPGDFEIPIPFVQGSMPGALIVGIATGMVLGVVNGLIVTKLKVNPIIATLGHPGRLRRPGLPGGAGGQAGGCGDAAGLHVAGHGPRRGRAAAARSWAGAPGPASPSSSSSS